MALLALSTWGCARRPPLLPESGTMEHYRIPWDNAFPSDVAVDDGGRLWFTDRLTHALGVFDPATEEFRRIQTPTGRSAPYGLVRAPDGALWFGESNGGRLGRLDPALGEITEVQIPELGKGPRLLVWAGNAVWFTAQRDGAYGRYVPSTGERRVWSGRIPEPYGIAAVDEQVWVASQGGSRVYRVDGSDGPVGSDSLPSLDLSMPAPIAVTEEQAARLPPERVERMRNRRRPAGIRRMAGGTGGRIWAAEYGRGRVTGVDPGVDERVHVETLSQPSRPYGLTADAYGRIWFSEQGNETLVVYDPRSGERRVLTLPVPGGTVRHIAVDEARRRVWLPLSDVGVIALVRY